MRKEEQEGAEWRAGGSAAHMSLGLNHHMPTEHLELPAAALKVAVRAQGIFLENGAKIGSLVFFFAKARNF